MRFRWLILLFLFPLISLAQNGVITGKVSRADNKEALPLANVFLSNTTFGTSTAKDGTFTLSHLKPGQYTLVVSILGYEDYSKTLLVGQEPINLDIELSPKVTQLRDVIVTTPANWKKNYDEFVKQFIGTDANAQKCYVLNPHVVNLIYHKPQQELEAYTDDFLIIDNFALGYRVKYLLKSFTYNSIKGEYSSAGTWIFQNLPGNKKQIEEWRKKREDIYYGSAMHFYRSLYTNKLDSDGFIIMKFTRILNPDRPQESIIMQKIKKYTASNNRDSLNHWIGQENMNKYAREHLYNNPHLEANDILMPTDHQGIFAVYFTDCLYIMYTKKLETVDFKDFYRDLNMETYEATILTTSKPYFFDTNGIVFGDIAPLYQGTWSKSRLSDLLPVDYTQGN